MKNIQTALVKNEFLDLIYDTTVKLLHKLQDNFQTSRTLRQTSKPHQT